jgi:hypothetical protein
MLGKLRNFRTGVRAARTWIQVRKRLHEDAQRVPVGERAPYVREIRKFESMLGNVILHLVGVYPLESLSDW